MTESSNVEFEFFGVKVHVSEIVHQHVNAVLSLASRGHLVPSKVEVESTGELLACASNLTLDLVDVKGFEGHGPTGQEVELRKVLSEQIGIFGVNVVAPLDLAALFLDDADGVIVFQTGERKFGDNDFDRFFTLLGTEGVDGGD